MEPVHRHAHDHRRISSRCSKCRSCTAAPLGCQGGCRPEPVVVLSKEANQKAFGGVNSVGKIAVWHDREFRVIGVLDDWEPTPKYFDVSNGSFTRRWRAPTSRSPGARSSSSAVDGNTNCWKTEVIDSYQAFLNSECIWFHGWFELRTAGEAARLPRVPRQLRARSEEARPLSATAQQLPVRRRRLAEAQQGGRRRQQGDAGHGVRLPRRLPGEHGRPAAGQVPERRAGDAGCTARARREPRATSSWQHLTESGVVALAGGIVGGLLGVAGIWALRAWYWTLRARTHRTCAAASTAHEFPDRGGHRGSRRAASPACIPPGVSGARRPPLT